LDVVSIRSLFLTQNYFLMQQILNSGWFFLKTGLALALIILCLSGILISSGIDAKPIPSGFDMRGKITNILSPSSIVVDKAVINLGGVDSSGLYRFTFSYLMDDLKYYIGKDVLVKGNYVYLDLQGSYNSISINEMIQKEISDLRDQQDYGGFYQSSYQSYVGYSGFEAKM
jgi:hypothetical protein